MFGITLQCKVDSILNKTYENSFARDKCVAQAQAQEALHDVICFMFAFLFILLFCSAFGIKLFSFIDKYKNIGESL